MEGETNELIATADDFFVASRAGFRQRQLIVFRLSNKMQHLFQQLLGLGGLLLQALGQDHGQLGRIHGQGTSNHSGIDALST